MNKMGHVAKLLKINFCLLPITRAAQQMCRCADVHTRSRKAKCRTQISIIQTTVYNSHLTFRKDIILHVSLLLKMCIVPI